MRPLSSVEYARAREAQINTMLDICAIGRYTETQDATGDVDHGDSAYSYTGLTPCSYIPLETAARITTAAAVTALSGVVRLPHDVRIDARDRIRLVIRAGLQVSEFYQVDGEPRNLATQIEVDVKRVTPWAS